MMKTENGRIAYWDNLKAILIFLVVLGHFLISVPDKGNMLLGVEYCIYLFHMPAFVFVSGFFSKSYIKKLQTTGKIDVGKIVGYLCIYVIFSLLIWAVAFAFNRTPLFSIDLLSVESAQWYILAMVIWLLILPVFVCLDTKISLISVFCIGIFVPALGELTDLFTLGRVINFLPFFVLGYYFKSEWILKIKSKKKYKIYAAVFLLTLGFAVFKNVGIITKYSRFLWQTTGYSFYPFRKIYCMIIKIFYYVLVSAVIMALLILCPERGSIFTKIGENTLGVYIGHRVLRDVIFNLGVQKYFAENQVTTFAFCVVFSVIITLVFSSKSINKICMLPFKIIKKGK